MTIQLTDLINGQDNLRQLTEIKFPVKVSYRLSKLLNKVTSELSTYEELRTKLITELGTEDKKTKQITVTNENLPKFVEELNKLRQVETEIDFQKIKIAELGDIQIEPKLLLEWVFE